MPDRLRTLRIRHSDAAGGPESPQIDRRAWSLLEVKVTTVRDDQAVSGQKVEYFFADRFVQIDLEQEAVWIVRPEFGHHLLSHRFLHL